MEPPEPGSEARPGASTEATGTAEHEATGTAEHEATGTAEHAVEDRRGWLRRRLSPRRRARRVMEALKTPRSVAIGWAVALVVAVLTYFLDLGAGSIANGDDALVALAAAGLHKGALTMEAAARTLSAPRGAPLALWGFQGALRLFGPSEAGLRLLPALSALGCGFCLLTIAIDTGLGRLAGGLGALLLLAMPLTYELSHRPLPDMTEAFAGALAVALLSHALHGFRFDRHVLPHHRDDEAPEALPLRRLPMVLAAAGVGVAALVGPRVALMALLVGVGDVLLANRYLLRKRRVWVALLAGAALTALTLRLESRVLALPWSIWTRPNEPALREALRLLWLQGEGPYGQIVGRALLPAAGFGVFLCVVRRVSRPVALWLLVAAAGAGFGEPLVPPRGMGLLLPPLALCAAVGLETPVRWLGRLGRVVTTLAVLGIGLSWLEGSAVLHRDDTVRTLAGSQRHAPADALLCTVQVPAAAPTLYTGRTVAEFRSPEELRAALHKDQPLSCIVPRRLREAVQRALIDRPRDAAPPPLRGRRLPPTPLLGSVLATVLDVEEPPPDTEGPQVVLINR